MSGTSGSRSKPAPFACRRRSINRWIRREKDSNSGESKWAREVIVAARKAKTTSSIPRRRLSSEYRDHPLKGKTSFRREWNPNQPEAQTPMIPEVREPRPYTNRYPISNEKFVALKKAAPQSETAQKYR
jgi:hypothetical protein